MRAPPRVRDRDEVGHERVLEADLAGFGGLVSPLGDGHGAGSTRHAPTRVLAQHPLQRGTGVRGAGVEQALLPPGREEEPGHEVARALLEALVERRPPRADAVPERARDVAAENLAHEHRVVLPAELREALALELAVERHPHHRSERSVDDDELRRDVREATLHHRVPDRRARPVHVQAADLREVEGLSDGREVEVGPGLRVAEHDHVGALARELLLARGHRDRLDVVRGVGPAPPAEHGPDDRQGGEHREHPVGGVRTGSR
jgi:hypothetical protein